MCEGSDELGLSVGSASDELGLSVGSVSDELGSLVGLISLTLILTLIFRSVYKELHADRETGC